MTAARIHLMVALAGVVFIGDASGHGEDIDARVVANDCEWLRRNSFGIKLRGDAIRQG